MIALDSQGGASFDKEITDVFALLAVLLVFVFAYFSALLPLAEDSISKPRSEIGSDRRRDASRVLTLLVLEIGLALVVLVVALLIAPLTYRSFTVEPANSEFPTIRWGLRAVEVMLLLLLAAAGWVVWRLRAKHAGLRKAEPGG